MNYNQSSSPVIKAVLLGNTEVGKTSLCSRFCQKSFDQNSAPTISASCSRTEVIVNNNAITFCIWDTAGQERFRSISPIYYRGAHVAIIVLSLIELQTIEVASSWYQELKRQATPGIPIVIIGNKVDLTDRRVISTEIASSFAQECNAPYFETSALTGENVDAAFKKAAELAYQFSKENNISPSIPTLYTEKSDDSSGNSSSKCC